MLFMSWREIACEAAGDHTVHHQAMAEALVRGAQHALAQQSALRVHDREGGVIAYRADVAEVIRQALELGHQSAQPRRARRHIDIERIFHRARKGERKGDCAIARYARGKQGRAFEWCARKERLGALMHIAKPLFEAHHRLAVRREAKMSRLDDPGVNGPYRNLMQALALRRQELIPARMAQPRTRVRQAFGLEAREIAHRALESGGGRMYTSDGRKAALLADQAEQARLVAFEQRHVRKTGLAPEAEQNALAFLQAHRGLLPLSAADATS
jgi:hypothetical protein